jgi:hypothetical protein
MFIFQGQLYMIVKIDAPTFTMFAERQFNKERTHLRKGNAGSTNLGQQTIIGWEPQIILGVPIFSQQTHLKGISICKKPNFG